MSDKSDFINAAIREKREREKGCPCCNGFHPDKLGEKIYVWSVQYTEVGDGQLHSVEPSFCPMCGREIRPKEVQA